MELLPSQDQIQSHSTKLFVTIMVLDDKQTFPAKVIKLRVSHLGLAYRWNITDNRYADIDLSAPIYRPIISADILAL